MKLQYHDIINKDIFIHEFMNSVCQGACQRIIQLEYVKPCLSFSSNLLNYYTCKIIFCSLRLNAKIFPTLVEQYDFQVLPTALVRGAVPQNVDVQKIPNLYMFNALQSLKQDSNISTGLTTDLVSFLKDYNRPSLDIDSGEPTLRLIVFDQFEEFFNTLPPNDWQKQQSDFFIQIIKALEDDPLLRIVFIMREEYVAKLDPFAYQLPGKLGARFRLEPLKRMLLYWQLLNL